MRRVIELERIPTTKPNTVIRTEVYYNVGGMNYFSGSSMKRGYYLSATPVRSEGNFTSVTAFSGTCELLLETQRFSQRKLQEVAADAGSKPIYQQLIAHVKSKNSLVLQSEAANLAPVPAAPAIATETITEAV